MTVSRETEAEPAAASTLFGERIDLARRYVELLGTTGVDHGLIGPRERPRLWSRHVLNCAVIECLIPRDAAVLDLGSGAGLPGLPIALARPDVRMVLVEPLERRVRWLDGALSDLDDPARVENARAEDVVGSSEASVLTCRALAPLDRLIRITLPGLRRGAVLHAIKGRSAVEEVAACDSILRRYKLRAEVVHSGAALLESPTIVVTVALGR